MSAHKPGPWFAELQDYNLQQWPSDIAVKPASEDGDICDMCMPNRQRPDLDAVTIANAHLIAAAPEMYDVLRLISETFALEAWAYDRGDEPRSIAEKLDAALKKARGEK